jgi:hypothetical protein
LDEFSLEPDMSKIERTFTKQTKDHGELQIASGQVWMDFEPANAATESLIERFLHEIGADYPTRGGRKKLVRVMSDVVMAARSANSGLIFWPMDNGCFTDGPYGAGFARLILECLKASSHLREQQKSSKWDKLARLYAVSLPHWLSACSFKPHGKGPAVEVRSRKFRDDAGRLVGGQRVSLKRFDATKVVEVKETVRSINAMMFKYPLVHPSGQTFMRCKRIFNQGSLTQGGRYYGGWQNLSEETRLTMTIGGSPVAEIDLKACFLVVLCGLYNKRKLRSSRMSMPFDPYSIIPFVRGCNDPERRVQMRELAKLLVCSLLADKVDLNKFPKGKKTKVTTNGRKKTISVREQYGLGRDVKASDLYGQTHETFPFIKEIDLRVFDLMFTESEIIGTTMHTLYEKQGIPTYPVHDCLMCRVQDVDQVLQQLATTTNDLLGSPISLDVTFPDRPTAYYKAVRSQLVECNKAGEVRKPTASWGMLDDDDDFDLIED